MSALLSLLFLLGCTGSYARNYKPKPQYEKPNIVFILADDLGWNDVSFHGSKQVPTPNIDALARDGIILNQYYVQSVCSPSRGSLMTGKYPMQIGLQNRVILNNAPWGLPLEEKILPQYLKDCGYNTHIVGKWHLGFFQKKYLPQERGFDSFFGYYTGLEDYFTHFSNWENMTGLDLHENTTNMWYCSGIYGSDLFTAKAVKVIEEHDPSKPLFLYLAQQAPHGGNFENPLQAPKKYVQRMVGIDDAGRKIFGGMLSSMDNSVGEIFGALDESGLLDNTIFIFSTDNGGSVEEFDGSRGSNWPLKGTKLNLWEGGVRGTAFVWSPFLRHCSRIYNGLMHISDWLPTLLSAIGGPEALNMLPGNTAGKDQWPSLAYNWPSPRDEILLNIDEVQGVEGIRKGRYKLVVGTYNNGRHDRWYDQEGRVFNKTYSFFTPEQKQLYERNYMRFLKRSKAANILWSKYGRDPLLAASCPTRACKKQLQVKCGRPPPAVPTCNATKEPCLYDIIKDPCEFYNIAKKMPEVRADLEQAIDEYRPYMIPAGNKPGDPKANPRLHGNVWIPWIK